MKKMKILVLSSFYHPDVGGVPVFLDCLIKNLTNAETQFIVVTKGYSDSLQVELNETKVYRLKAFGKFREILGKSWKSAISKRFEISSYAKEYAKSIVDLITNERPSIVHAHDVPSYLLGCEISSILNVPLVFTSHSVPTTLQGIPYSEEGLIFWKDLYKEACYDILTVGSNFALTKCLEAGAPQNKVEVISPGVDVEKFRPGLNGEIIRLKLKLESKSALIFSPVRPDPRKGLIDVLRASTKLLQHIENFLFLFSPSSDEYLTSTELVSTVSESIRRKLKFYTFHHDEMPLVYNASDVVVIPSRIETFGLSAAEAMACGKPVIATNAGALPELIQNNVNGILYTPGEIDELAKEILEVLSNRRKAEKLGEEAAKSIRNKQLSDKACAQKYKTLYLSLVS